MTSEIAGYGKAVEAIKTAILQAQYAAAKSANAQQLQLYYAVGGYISANTRSGAWGTGALKVISGQLQRELPGLRGFSERNLKYMRTFFEEWGGDFDEGMCSNSADTTAELVAVAMTGIRQLQLPNCSDRDREAFFSIGFTHHCLVLTGAKTLAERLFYIHKCATEHLSVEALKRSIKADDFHHQGKAPNNYLSALPKGQQALRAITTFKDEYLLDFINVEELGVRDPEDVDERVLDDFERREHENPSIGLVLCKDMNKAFVDYIIQDFNKPMGVATYATSADMSRELLEALPPIEDLKALLEDDGAPGDVAS